MKETFYFSHDFYARQDPKLMKVLRIHGMSGIGVYWCLIEMLYEQGGSVELSSVDDYAFSMRVKTSLVESIINDFGLFQNDGERFWSKAVRERTDKRAELADRQRKNALSGWQKRQCQSDATAMPPQCQSDATAMPPQCQSDATAMPPQCQSDATAMPLKERKKEKEKENPPKGGVKEKAKDATRFRPPTLEEVNAYILAKGYSMNGERFMAHYESNGWFVGKNKMRSWKAAVSGWEIRDREERKRKVTSFENRRNEKFSNNEWS